MSPAILPLNLDEGVHQLHRRTFKRLRCLYTTTFSGCYEWGSDALLSKQLVDFFLTDVKCHPVSAERISQYICFYAREAVRQSSQEAAWVTVRTMSNATFTGPRWHTDGSFFGQAAGYKRVGTILGPPTRFGITRERERFDCLEYERSLLPIKYRNDGVTLAKRMKEIDSEINAIVYAIPEQASPDGVYITDFRFGEGGAIHSEPDLCLTDERIFFSIVPGRLDLIKNWLRNP